jgi:hypothetical protein
MATNLSEELSRRPTSMTNDWRGRQDMQYWDRGSRGSSTGLLVTGLAVIGLGALAWYYLGPDLVRYMKIERM